MNKNALEILGYKVYEARDGDEAVQIFQSHKDEIDIVLLDVIMPKKNGKEAFEIMKKMKENIKALFMSGYTENLIHKRGVLEEGINFISKPLSPIELGRKIRMILDQK